MNLLAKLKPEFKAVLVDKMYEYPHMKESIFKTLEQKEYVIQLTIAESTDIANYLSNRSFAHIYELFKEEF